MKNLPPVFCAIDTADLGQARKLALAVTKAGCGLKLGLEFFSAHGPGGVREIMLSCGQPPLFLDLKFHDIPNTVAGAVRAVLPLTPVFLTVHAAGGEAMMRAAREAAGGKTGILAVTVLTSLDDQALNGVGFDAPAEKIALRLAQLAKDAGLAGAVCSPHEIDVLRRACGSNFVLMVPGIRPAGADDNDQRRIMSPREARRAGAAHLVIGRPITQATDPAAAARGILKDIEFS